MSFISWAFFLLMLPVLAARLTLGRKRTEPLYFAFIMLASTVFVCWYIPIYICIMLVSIGVDYVAARLIWGSPANSPWRGVYLFASLATNLLLLSFFKYANFFLGPVRHLLAIALPHAPTIPVLAIALPMGISFYTFGSMSYTIDVYRGRMQPVQHFGGFYFFLTFFPHMVAGPIIRAEQFFYQVWRRRRLHLRVFNEGAYQIIRGLFLKMVLADHIGHAVEGAWPTTAAQALSAPSPQLLLLAVLFGAQIFCDFEGYTSIARGLAYWLGFRFPLNFNNPYLAGSFSNFWERWHITLSTWLRDYLYIPLGGNRKSRVRTYANLLVVMVLGGLWHGAAGTFVVWGCVHGLALAGERLLGLNGKHGWRRFVIVALPWYLVTQIIVLLTWVLFRSDTIDVATGMVVRILHWTDGPIVAPLAWASLALLPVVVMHLHGFLVEHRLLRPIGRMPQAVMAAVLLMAVLTLYARSTAFIYFRF